jgi:hypothetical protein
MLEHAVHSELAGLMIINLDEGPDTCGLIAYQCIALAHCTLDRRTAAPWPLREGHRRLRQPHRPRPRKLR